VEAVVIASVGGLIGLVLGGIGAAVIANLSPLLNPTLDWNSVALAVGFSAGVGLFFGLYPATRAARLSPIDALRYE
jgi:putative ABC transport system permease protein